MPLSFYFRPFGQEGSAGVLAVLFHEADAPRDAPRDAPMAGASPQHNRKENEHELEIFVILEEETYRRGGADAPTGGGGNPPATDKAQ